jgi:tetratricopeptide (TPR) repeat protein
MSEKTPSVFISHSSKDNEFALWLAGEIKTHGIEVWLDEHKLRPGDPLYAKIGDGLITSDHFIIILSKNSIDSPWVTQELYIAQNREIKEKRQDIIIPVLLEQVAVPPFIEHKKYADFTSKENFEVQLGNVLEVFGVEFQQSEQKERDKKPAKLYPNQFLPDLKFFVGREELLKKIKNTLATQHRAAIHDISGLGKTFTTYKFASDNHENYENVFFIRATREEMLESLAKCGEMVNPSLAEVGEQQAKALGFKQWLEENEKWLVIYDNVDLPDELFPFVPVNKKGDCIFTSNFREVRNLGTEINIVKLDRADAEILLYSRANNRPLTKPDLDGDERVAFDSLIKEIDGLPLTLNSTGALVDKKQWSFADLWKRYERSKEILWESEDDYSVYQRRSAGIVFSLAYDELCGSENTGNAVKIVLDTMSFISPDEIPEDLLRKILTAQDESFAQLEESDDLWDDVRDKHTAYDLLKYDKNKKTFTTHRAIQRVIQSRLKGTEKEICIALAKVLRGLFPGYIYSNRGECEKYYQHVIVLLENADKFGAESGDTNEICFRSGDYQLLLGNYAPAEQLHTWAAQISASVFGAESNEHARDLNSLANVYQDQGRYDEAIEKFEESLLIAEKTVGREHQEYAIRLNNLANVHQLQGRYDKSTVKYEEALRITKKALGPEHPSYATRLNNLGLAYAAQGRKDEAIEKFEESLLIGEKTIGRDHPAYSTRLNNLAGVYLSQDRYEEAIGKYEEALSIDEKTLGRDHPEYATGLSNLAHVYEAQGNFNEALELFKNALRIFENKLPEGHPHIAQLRRSVKRCGKLVD